MLISIQSMSEWKRGGGEGKRRRTKKSRRSESGKENITEGKLRETQ